ncbi:hypothetical protein WA538_004234, partial [Blastocystis sp. DL]
TAGSYIAFWTKSDLSRLSLRYGRIFFHGEIWRLFSSLLLIDYPTWYTKIFLVIFVVHLRTMESRPVMLTEQSNPFCNFLVSVVFAIIGFWITCLFYPLYYGGHFIIMVLLTIETTRSATETFNLIGFIIPRRYLPLIYTFLTFVNNGTLMCQLFGMLWGSLYLRLARNKNPLLISLLYRIQHCFHIEDFKVLERAELRSKIVSHSS